MVERRVGRDQHPPDAGDSPGVLRRSGGVRADQQEMRFAAELARRAEGGEGRILDLAAGMLTENQDLHATTPSDFSLVTSSSTLPTLAPPWRSASGMP